MPRFHCPVPLAAGAELELPAAAARHVQVLRLQPGGVITLFNGDGGEYSATILRMGRSDVAVRVDSHQTRECEPSRRVHLAVGMPANDRMDWLVEKATELGVASVQPLHTAHSVLRLSGERATKKQAHWQAVATAACEQCGGNRVPTVMPVAELAAWLKTANLADPADAATPLLRCVLSLADGSQPLAAVLASQPAHAPVLFLSGPEGGLSPSEDAAARAAGFVPVTLGPRVLRAETAALAALVLAAQ
ncbi:MAG: 16S rRNA (uracil(1498)-N(3))-methyltransferase [Hydrogenophaga sp.]|nr:16S rRNA (uracil(1498)-N(3))-methyltransferase [Hydrogenophaga sp.]MDO9611839.1 16S rRNA (uracil(1498)-N(3))-methyltransferase [Serpentinimonas sp.]